VPKPADDALPDLSPLSGKQTGAEVTKLVGLMQRLLAPDGCPWDREQTLETLVPYLVEETYEVVDALADGDVDDHREELGDLLLQIVFQSELRFAEGKFGIDDVARGIVAKLVRRHPHVFGDVTAKDADAVLANWAKLKAAEKAEKGKHGALDGIPKSAPALLRATRAGEKASAVGFDWPDAHGPRAKVDEEMAELDEAWKRGDRAAMQHELGDALQALVNLARKLGLDAEVALRASTDRFARRFRFIETTLGAEGRAVSDADAAEQDRLWREAKLDEAKLDEAKLDEAKLDEAKLDEAKLDEAKSAEADAKHET
jgi:MazG family protein